MPKKKISRILFIYTFLLFTFVIIKFHGSIYELIHRAEMFDSVGYMRYNIEPFRNIKVQLSRIHEFWAMANFFGNIIPFIPLGILVPMRFPKMNHMWIMIPASIVFIFAVECFQYFTGIGIFDVDDIILNSIGIICGYIGKRSVEFILAKVEGTAQMQLS